MSLQRRELDDSLLASTFLEDDCELVVFMLGRLETRTILEGFTVSCVALMFKSFGCWANALWLATLLLETAPVFVPIAAREPFIDWWISDAELLWLSRRRLLIMGPVRRVPFATTWPLVCLELLFPRVSKIWPPPTLGFWMACVPVGLTSRFELTAEVYC